MALTDLIKSAAAADDLDAATALASKLNSDQTFRVCLGSRKEFTATDIIRIGKDILSYAQGLPKVSELHTEVRAQGEAAVAGSLNGVMNGASP